jgi:hypothetical protein
MLTFYLLATAALQFLSALQQIGALVSPGSNSGVLGLLTSLNTIQSAVGNNTGSTQVSTVLNALKTVGSVLNPTFAASSSGATNSVTSGSLPSTTTTAQASTTATSPLKLLVAAGEDVVKNLQAVLPTGSTGNGGLADLNLPALLKFVQSVGAFFTKLSAFQSVVNNALSG